MFNPDYFKVLVRETAEAREVETSCDECFEQLDRFVEMRQNGKIAERWATIDTLSLLQQLGVIPTPGQSEEASPT
jgi:hypothetical protein